MRRLFHCSANLAFAILVILADQPLSRAEPMIGQNMEFAKLPFVASLASKRFKLGPDGPHFCLGSLIAKNLVLTAAHCLEIPNYEDVEVVIGMADLRAAKPKHGVHSWTTFANWAATKGPRMTRLRFHDMAIVTLRRPVVGVTPANISTLRIEDLHGRNATIIGWAAGYDGGRRFLKQAEVQILTTADCEKRFELLTGFSIPVPEGTLCSDAADPFALSTQGDSGGPLLDENNNILGLTTDICPEYASDCTDGFVDRFRFNFHMDLIDEFRQFIDEMKARYPSKQEFIKFDI